MLAKRIIPCLDVDCGRVVKGVSFIHLRDAGDPLEPAADTTPPNPAAVPAPKLVERCAKRFGSQCIVVAVDAKGLGNDRWEVYTHGGRTPTGIDAVEWAKKVVELGAGEILLTSMDTDGHLDGYDIPITRAISEAGEGPVIASGGR